MREGQNLKEWSNNYHSQEEYQKNSAYHRQHIRTRHE